MSKTPPPSMSKYASAQDYHEAVEQWQREHGAVAFTAMSTEDETMFVVIGVDSIGAFEQALIANKLTGQDPQDPDYAFDKPLQAWAVYTERGWSFDATSATEGARPAMVATAFWVGDEDQRPSKCTGCAVQDGTHAPSNALIKASNEEYFPLTDDEAAEVMLDTMAVHTNKSAWQQCVEIHRVLQARYAQHAAQLAAAQQGVPAKWNPSLEEMRAIAKQSGMSEFGEAIENGLTVYRETLIACPADLREFAMRVAAATHPTTQGMEAQDAERYRWLKSGNDEKHSRATFIAQNMYGMEWDDAIDAELAAQAKRGDEA